MEIGQKYIILPKRGKPLMDRSSAAILAALPHVVSTEPSIEMTLSDASFLGHATLGPEESKITVIDSAPRNLAKLVAMDTATAARINSDPAFPLRAEPIITYDLPIATIKPLTTPVATISSVIECRDSVTGVPIQGAQVRAFTNFKARTGGSGTTDESGRVQLNLETNAIDRIFIDPPAGYWGAYRSSVALASPYQINLTPVDLDFVDGIRALYPKTAYVSNAGIRIGVIDTGIGPHSDLNVVKGLNTVTGEPANDFTDCDKHGTHVAGIIGARAAPGKGVNGIAPGVELCSYRVFRASSKELTTTTYAIMKAMWEAIADKCDIINLSLGGGPPDRVVAEAIQDARNHGSLVVIAAGNDSRQPVSYPAAYPGATAVSALGIEGTYPKDSLQEGEVARPPYSGSHEKYFIASFSNFGPQIAVTAPGVGILSTFPNNKYGPLSGTSMAAPVISGAAASLLSQSKQIYEMPRDRDRADAIEKMLQQNCVRTGFDNNYEGYGLPDPDKV